MVSPLAHDRSGLGHLLVRGGADVTVGLIVLVVLVIVGAVWLARRMGRFHE